MDSILTDGQHKHGEKLRCFFCMNWKQNCQIFRLQENPDHPPEHKLLYNQGFVICPECDAKGPEHKAEQLVHWIKTQGFLNKHGVGLADIEQHKRTGQFPKLGGRRNKKRKRK